jgi:hypothetical protein
MQNPPQTKIKFTSTKTSTMTAAWATTTVVPTVAMVVPTPAVAAGPLTLIFRLTPRPSLEKRHIEIGLAFSIPKTTFWFEY